MKWLKRVLAHMKRSHNEIKGTSDRPLLVVRSTDPDQPVRLRTDTDLFSMDQRYQGIEND